MLRNFLPIRHYVRKSGLPGLNKLPLELKDVRDIMEDPEGLGDVESDFMDVHKTHKDHVREMQRKREQIKHFIVGNKYFKTKQPNFLTYAEKEQMRLLHARDPEEWNPEKLSESFPATPEIIAKIIQGRWTARSGERIKRHDQGVLENWKMLREGKMEELDPALVEHLRKFSHRNPEDLKNLETTVRPQPQLPRPSRTEFSSIITEGMKFRKSAQIKDDLEHVERIAASSGHSESAASNPFRNDKSTPPTNKPPINVGNSNFNNSSPDEETYLIDKIQNHKPIRFQDLVRKNPEIQQDPKIVAMHTMANPQGTGILSDNVTSNVNFSTIKKMETNEIQISPRDLISTHSGIREKIHIPKHLWRRGCTFKLRDCYYDDDGEFLYRVPGMTGSNAK